MLCIAAAGQVLSLAVAAFTLSWTHSVERTEWLERWQVQDGALRLEEARVQGPGAGIHLPEGARATGDGWTYRPQLPPQRRLTLAASGATGAGWSLCTDLGCREFGRTGGPPVEIWSATECAAPVVKR
ncbi:MAG TPA: DUF1850 domain-containing protein [Devosiaceae bacterium]|jgi:hypothetical protein|nr:DUF1850 domain-containing protein [Devosiaceae bacterium]